MSFIPNYRTKDGIFEVSVDMDNLSYEPRRRFYGSEKMDMTSNDVEVYNTSTRAYSTKSVYISRKGLYFNAPGLGRYYLKELERI